MLKYIVRVQINYPSPCMEINRTNFSSTFSDKDTAYQYYNDLVNKYLTNRLILIKITLSEYDIDGYAKKAQSVMESWSNMDG